uniref:Uncharacterized protein n=1 Tax=Phage sp. ctKtV17 TaxID=2825792 RepID=A0A8S5UY85_9VIRU|nr:MAG TPA: hypothetical protein [Phage sp. ctKtV17]
MASSTTGHSKASPCQWFLFLNTGILYNPPLDFLHTRGPVITAGPLRVSGGDRNDEEADTARCT